MSKRNSQGSKNEAGRNILGTRIPVVYFPF